MYIWIFHSCKWIFVVVPFFFFFSNNFYILNVFDLSDPMRCVKRMCVFFCTKIEKNWQKNLIGRQTTILILWQTRICEYIYCSMNYIWPFSLGKMPFSFFMHLNFLYSMITIMIVVWQTTQENMNDGFMKNFLFVCWLNLPLSILSWSRISHLFVIYIIIIMSHQSRALILSLLI